MLGQLATPLFVTGVVAGAMLLSVGLALGFWLGRRVQRPTGALDDYHLGKLLQGLFRWTDGFASDVSKYRELVDQVKNQVNAVDGRQAVNDPTALVGILSQFVQANDLLQQRLNTAEQTLQSQATDIASYLSEARTDTLTELPNRRVFDDELARYLAEFRRGGPPFSVVLIDIDHFKQFNDQYGHLAGDAVLTQVAKQLRASMREPDLVARLGGEEFAILLPATDSTEAGQTAERARIAIDRESFQYEGQPLRVTISCGAAQISAGEDATSLIKRADQAMYAAKAAGRNFAHWHNGRESIAITPRESAPARRAPPPIAPDADFARVCDDLRRKMQAVLNEPK